MYYAKCGGALEAANGRPGGDYSHTPNTHPAHPHESGRAAGYYRWVS